MWTWSLLRILEIQTSCSSIFEITTTEPAFMSTMPWRKFPDLIAHLESGKGCGGGYRITGLPWVSLWPRSWFGQGSDWTRDSCRGCVLVLVRGHNGFNCQWLAPQPHISMDFCLAKEGNKGLFQRKVAYPETQIFYESPHRVKATFKNMLAVYRGSSVVPGSVNWPRSTRNILVAVFLS